MKTAAADALVIFGATGDLCARKIFPALYNLVRDVYKRQFPAWPAKLVNRLEHRRDEGPLLVGQLGAPDVEDQYHSQLLSLSLIHI